MMNMLGDEYDLQDDDDLEADDLDDVSLLDNSESACGDEEE